MQVRIWFGVLLLVVTIDSIAGPAGAQTQHIWLLDSVKRFHIVTSEGIDRDPFNPRLRFSRLVPADTPFGRFIDWREIDSLLPINHGRHFRDNPLWYPANASAAVHDSTNGPEFLLLPMESSYLLHALNNSAYSKIEMARHPQRDVYRYGYDGWMEGAGLTGRNDTNSSNEATIHQFLHGSEVEEDTVLKSLELKVGRDGAGISNKYLYGNFFEKHRMSKYRFRFRIKLDTLISDTSLHPTLFTVTCVVGPDSIHHQFVLDESSSAALGAWSEVSFVAKLIPNQERPVSRFELYWPGLVSMHLDHMEIFTAAPSPEESIEELGIYSWITDTASNRASAGYENTVLNGGPVREHVSKLKADFMRKPSFWYMQDEPLLNRMNAWKHTIKIFRDSTGGMIEPTVYTYSDHDSAYSQNYGEGIPNKLQYLTEGVRRGWLDSSKYADPSIFFVDPYPFGTTFPVPKRITSDETNDYNEWSLQFSPAATWSPIKDGPRELIPIPYHRSDYLRHSQRAFTYFAAALRAAKAITERNEHIGQRFGICSQSGGGVEVYRDTTGGTDKFLLARGTLRPPTGTEYKLPAHLATSVGASILLLYHLRDLEGPASDGGIIGPGLNRDSNYVTISRKEKTYYTNQDTLLLRRMWMGWQERFDTARKLFPLLQTYGNTLARSRQLADYYAWELQDTAHDKFGGALPFEPTSIRSLSDEGIQDATGVTDTVITREDGERAKLPWSAGTRTYVHTSVWIDTASASHDTLLYITNMRTDDSWDSTGKPSTMDRRLITMRLNRPHIIQDVADTNGSLDPGRVWTPYVGGPGQDTLKVWLLAGDGILLRLMDTIPSAPMKQMMVKLDFPKGSQQFHDHGRIVFDRPLKGVRNKVSDWSIPSTSRPYVVGIEDAAEVAMRQDSLLYQKIHNTRPELWRHHSWKQENFDGTSKGDNFVHSIGPIGSEDPRPRMTGTDSIAQGVEIKALYEDGTSAGGEFRFYDPWFVYYPSYLNANTTADSVTRPMPFQPQNVIGETPGADLNGYGGIFLKQNILFDSSKIMYAAAAYPALDGSSKQAVSRVPENMDWSFLHWWRNDAANVFEPSGLWVDSLNPNTNVPLVFMRENAEYVARYKAHMASFVLGSALDSGFSTNSQRKLLCYGYDSLDRPLYRAAYSSLGRVYSLDGFMDTITTHRWIRFQPERLLTNWNDQTAEFPALSFHRQGTGDARFRYVYQKVYSGNTEIVLSFLQDGVPKNWLVGTDGATAATPVIGTTNVDGNIPMDVIAYATDDGIKVQALKGWNGSGINFSTPVTLGVAGARNPTIWVDSCSVCGPSYGTTKFWVAWEQDTAISGRNSGLPTAEIFVAPLEVRHTAIPNQVIVSGQGNTPIVWSDLSYQTRPTSLVNRQPCISGARLHTDSTVVRIAYETWEGAILVMQGIAVAHTRVPGQAWTQTTMILSPNTFDRYSRPSLEVSRYRAEDTGTVKADNFFSLAFHSGHAPTPTTDRILQISLDSASQRVTGSHFNGTQNPQLSVIFNSVDTLIHRIAQSSPNAPLWLVSKRTSLFKLNGIDSVWGYRGVSESDSSGVVHSSIQYGELAVDNGNTVCELEHIWIDEAARIGGETSAERVMRSETFTMPSIGQLSYYVWANASDDSLFRTKVGAVQYSLDFFDTSGTFVMRLDSLELRDSMTSIPPHLRTVYFDNPNSQRGYVTLRRTAGDLTEERATWRTAVSLSRLSSAEGMKRGTSRQEEKAFGLSVEPNPTRGLAAINFNCPAEGAVTLEVSNALGQSTEVVLDSQYMRSGAHTIQFNTARLRSGIYQVRLTHGGKLEIAKLLVVR